ncbi:site-specific DNA-methyltransferase [Hymenobacter sp. HD11105]
MTPTADLRARLLDTPGLSDADRAQLNNLFDRQQQYGLVWEEKPEKVEEDLRQYLPVLDEVPERAIVATDSTAPQHTLIEGDNLHALTVLNYTHAGQVDVIYIDPPYNTGNKDFIYNDHFVDREDNYRHSKWLSFMAKRLKLAKKLLKETGVIFISIDDNEQAQLKLLCDGIFGEENFVANVMWQKKYAGSNDHKTIAPMHDFVLVYRNTEQWQRRLVARSDKNNSQYRHEDEKGVYRADNYTCNKSAEERPNLYYPVINPNTGEEIWPKRTAVWRYSKERHSQNVAENLVYWGKEGTGKTPAFKRYRDTLAGGGGTVPNTWWDHEFAGHNDQAKKELLELFDEAEKNQLFSTPKPTSLIHRVLQIAYDSDALVLDFFAGSGTTLHATMALNAEDGGTRRCILVTNNENNICEQVTYERNRRVIQGYTTPKGMVVQGLSNNSLRYYRTALAESSRRVEHKRALVRRATELLCFKDGCHFPLVSVPAHSELCLFGNQPTASMRFVLMVYDEAAVGAAVDLLDALLPPAGTISAVRAFVYVFADGHDPYTDDFEPVAGRGAELCAVPEALLQAYKKARTTSRVG